MTFTDLSVDMLAAGELEIIENLSKSVVSQDPALCVELSGRIRRLKDTVFYTYSGFCKG